MRFPCPNCGSTRSRKVPEQQSFQVHASRRCRDCGHVWEPPAPRWLLWLGLVVGLACVATGAGFAIADRLLNAGEFTFKFLWLCGLGLMAIVGCWRRLAHTPSRPDPLPPDPIEDDPAP